MESLGVALPSRVSGQLFLVCSRFEWDLLLLVAREITAEPKQYFTKTCSVANLSSSFAFASEKLLAHLMPEAIAPVAWGWNPRLCDVDFLLWRPRGWLCLGKGSARLLWT